MGKATQTIVVERRGNPGLLAGVFGCVFGVLGIVTLGIVFVPLAALCSVIGLLRGMSRLSGSGIAVSLLGGVLTIAGFVASPSLWLVAGGLIAAGQAEAPTGTVQSATPYQNQQSSEPTRKVSSQTDTTRVAVVAAANTASQGQQNAPVTDCDTYAANPLDSGRKAAGVPLEKVDADLSIRACESAVRQYPTVSRFIFQLGRAYNKKNDFAAAVAQYRKAADQGYASAQNNLGNMYSNGQGVPKDDAMAAGWYRKAAEQGLVGAQFGLGAMYYAGRGVTQNYAEAMRWYLLAGDQGDARAQNDLGVIYDKGLGVPADSAEAAKWYRKAADRGNAVAQHNLGGLYENGRGVQRDYGEAAKWYRKAADLGNANGQVSLGFLYYRGQGIPTNLAEARKWFRAAADQGDVTANSNLGVMYEKGLGVPQDYAEAIRWYRRAANLGNVDAQSKVSELYAQFPALRAASPDTTRVAANVVSPTMPEVERLLIAAVEKGRATFAAGSNEMAQGAARPARAKEICALLKDLRVNNWLGEVETLSSNSDGLGVLSIRIANGISVKTWNNAISDVGDRTLIDPESAVFKQAIALKKGQKVSFTGQFFLNPTDCIRESSLTLKGSLSQPEFIFRFSGLAAVE